MEQFTRLSNIALPKAFKISYFATKKDAVSRDDRRLVGVIHGEITSVSVSSVTPASDSAGQMARTSPAQREGGGVLYVTDRRIGSPEQPGHLFHHRASLSTSAIPAQRKGEDRST